MSGRTAAWLAAALGVALGVALAGGCNPYRPAKAKKISTAAGAAGAAATQAASAEIIVGTLEGLAQTAAAADTPVALARLNELLAAERDAALAPAEAVAAAWTAAGLATPAALAQRQFAEDDVPPLQEALFFAPTARILQHRGAAETARRLAGWVARQVMLVPEGELPVASPMLAVVRGRGTPAERVGVFLTLCGQCGLHAAALAGADAAADQAGALAVAFFADSGKSTTIVFDFAVGLPVFAADGKTPATLAEVWARPELWRGRRGGAAGGNLGKPRLLHGAWPAASAPRFAALQPYLKGDHRVAAWFDAAGWLAAAEAAGLPEALPPGLWAFLADARSAGATTKAAAADGAGLYWRLQKDSARKLAWAGDYAAAALRVLPGRPGTQRRTIAERLAGAGGGHEAAAGPTIGRGRGAAAPGLHVLRRAGPVGQARRRPRRGPRLVRPPVAEGRRPRFRPRRLARLHAVGHGSVRRQPAGAAPSRARGVAAAEPGGAGQRPLRRGDRRNRLAGRRRRRAAVRRRDRRIELRPGVQPGFEGGGFRRGEAHRHQSRRRTPEQGLGAAAAGLAGAGAAQQSRRPPRRDRGVRRRGRPRRTPRRARTGSRGSTREQTALLLKDADSRQELAKALSALARKPDLFAGPEFAAWLANPPAELKDALARSLLGKMPAEERAALHRQALRFILGTERLGDPAWRRVWLAGALRGAATALVRDGKRGDALALLKNLPADLLPAQRTELAAVAKLLAEQPTVPLD